jgi:glycerol-3-phosphate dehydrogenase
VYAQVDWAIQQEMARTLEDVLVRRTQIFYRASDQGVSALEVLSQYMGKALNWDEERRLRDVAAYKARVGLSMQWKRQAGAK